MVNFVLVPDPYYCVGALLTTAVSGFARSSEYAVLTEEERRSQFAVAGAFRRYLERVQSRILHGEPSRDDALALKTSFDVLEALCTSESAKVLDLVTSGILENLGKEAKVRAAIVAGLGPKARQRYDAMEESFRQAADWLGRRLPQGM